MIASLAGGVAVEGLGQATADPIDEEIIFCENGHLPRLGGHRLAYVHVEVSDHEEDPGARYDVVHVHVTHSDDVAIIHELAVHLKLQIGRAFHVTDALFVSGAYDVAVDQDHHI